MKKSASTNCKHFCGKSFRICNTCNKQFCSNCETNLCNVFKRDSCCREAILEYWVEKEDIIPKVIVEIQDITDGKL